MGVEGRTGARIKSGARSLEPKKPEVGSVGRNYAIGRQNLHRWLSRPTSFGGRARKYGKSLKADAKLDTSVSKNWEGKMDEVWKEIPGYGGAYLISSMGRLWSEPSARLLALRVDHGYAAVFLRAKRFYIHRLVAEAFVPRPSGATIVTHLNFNHRDNRASNLEWTTSQGKNDRAFAACRFPHQKQAVICTTTGERFESGSAAGKALSLHGQSILACAVGKRKSVGGYVFALAK
jgi:hypothetical protein